ncbi:hypothetical protein FRC02_004023, partial [Tulasnella sp. 418]
MAPSVASRTALIILMTSAGIVNAAVPLYGQCGGNNYTGETVCVSGAYCAYQNEWYSQCLPGTGGGATTTVRPTSTTGGGSTPTGATFKNPIKASQGSDPFMVYDNGYYYLLSTTWSNVQMSRGTSMTALKAATPKLVWSDTASNRCCNVWAPEVHKISGKWWLYYTAGPSGTSNYDGQRVHVLEGGSTPWDTYTYRGQLKPTNAPDAWALDGSILTVNGALYFVFSGIGSTGLQSLFIAPM